MSHSHGAVLYVEDEPGIIELVSEALAPDGWELRAAATGARGLEVLSTESIQLLLLDYALPDMLGTQFLDRAVACGRRIPPFIVTTGVGSEPIAVEMMKRGAADYLVKDSHFLAQLPTVVRRVAHETELAQRLEKTELQLRFLAQHLPDILTILDRDGRPQYCSPAAEAVTGYTLQELERASERLVHPDDRALAQTWWSEVTSRPDATARATFRLLRRDGAVVWLEAVAQNHLESPALQGVIVNARDVTARKEAEQERLEMQRQLLHAQKLESLGVLAGGIAHDFNNLLAVIVGNLDLAVGCIKDDAEAKESVVAAVKAAQRAGHLTRQMLAYSGRGTFALEMVDISALMKENVQIFGVSVSRNVELITQIAPNMESVLASPGQIQQVVMNLLTNASEAIGDGHGQITLSAGQNYLSSAELGRSLVGQGAVSGEYVYLSVSDTGCGMSQAVLERLFDPFFTTKRTGRGLGMAAVLGIVRGHGGALFVESSVGRGTTVRVCFPVHRRKADAAISNAVGCSSHEFRKRVLVVDDESCVRAMAVRSLQRLGCSTVEAADGREALDVIEKDPSIDAILMDLTMPNLGGAEATSLLQQRGYRRPIILCSGYGEAELDKGGPAGVATAFLQKPFRLVELQALLARIFSTS